MRAKLRVPLPPTLNEQIGLARTHWAVSAKVKKQETARIAQLCKINRIPRFIGPVWVVCNWKVNNFGRDADNLEAAQKYLMDGLVKAKVIADDNLRIIQPVKIHFFERTKGDDVVDVVISSSPVFQLIELPDEE